jgi:putative transposase
LPQPGRRSELAARSPYHRSRTHLSLSMDAPASRAVMSPETGEVLELPEVGGLHHRYERRAA